MGAAQEVAKYQVKDSDIITGNTERDLKVIDDLESSLKNTKKISYGGIFKKLRNAVKASK